MWQVARGHYKIYACNVCASHIVELGSGGETLFWSLKFGQRYASEGGKLSRLTVSHVIGFH
jgi:hypothetical protein